MLRRSLGSALGALAGLVAAEALAAPGAARATNGQPILQAATNSGSGPTIVSNANTVASSAALVGTMTAASPGQASAGVRGINRGPSGSYGVLGEHLGSGIGVLGRSASLTGVSGSGVIGTYGIGSTLGILGTGPTGVRATGSGSESTGLEGDATYGVVGYGTTTGVFGSGPNGVVGASTVKNAAAVYGSTTQPGGMGVYGKGYSGVYGTGTYDGLRGVGTSGGYGVDGSGAVGVLGSGVSIGVQGQGGSIGVKGNTSTSAGTGVLGSGLIGVYGSSTDVAVRGDGGNTGVYGVGSYSGVSGKTNTVYNTGLRGEGTVAGSYGITATGVYDSSLSAGGSGIFYGRMWVHGDIVGFSGLNFMDHPLDPANRTLSHSTVHSPDRLNVYSGSVSLDAKGGATVRLPRYFDALNTDHRVQLTAVGAPAPELHVATKVADGRFRIAGGQSGQEVFWQVTGTRNDAYARKNRVRVDAPKPPSQRGKYVNPEVFGKGASASIHYQPARKMAKPPKILAPRRAAAPEPPRNPGIPRYRPARIPRMPMP